MTKVEDCAFCDPAKFEGRTIRRGELMTSVVPVPAILKDAVLVFPNRHTGSIDKILPAEWAAVMSEVGRLAIRLDRGNGYGFVQKEQTEGRIAGVTVPGHPHIHVFGRELDEDRLFPVPEPNNADGLYFPSDDEVQELVVRLR